jgi:methyltransferase (TIGR00027 family)
MRCSLALLLTVAPLLNAFLTMHAEPRKVVAHKALSLLHPHDPMSFILAGQTAIQQVRAQVHLIEKEQGTRAAVHLREMYAVRTKYMNVQIQKYLLQNTCDQTLILGAGMDTRVYSLPCLSNSHVYEIDHKSTLQVKEHLIACYGNHIPLVAESVQRIAHTFGDVNQEDLVLKLYRHGYSSRKPAVFILEGALHGLRRGPAINLLKLPLRAPGSLLVFDIKQNSFIRDPKTWMGCQGYTDVECREVEIDGHAMWIISGIS